MQYNHTLVWRRYKQESYVVCRHKVLEAAASSRPANGVLGLGLGCQVLGLGLAM